MGKFIAGVDWNNDGFICRFCTRTDRLQSIRTWIADPLDLDTYLGSITAGLTSDLAVQTLNDGSGLGLEYYQVNANAAGVNDGVVIFADIFSSDYQITTTNTRVYNVVFWLKSGGGNYDSANTGYRARIYTNDYTDLEVSDSGNISSSAWTKITLTFTATSSDNLVLEVIKTNAGTRSFKIAGLMVFESTTSISVPAGYNTGFATDIHEAVTPDVKSMTWQLGMFKPFQQMADEGLAHLMLRNNSGLYMPENNSSPLYGYINPSLTFEIGHYLGTAHNDYRIMYFGQLDSPPINIVWDELGASVGMVEVELIAISNKVFMDNQAFEYDYQAASANIGTTIKDIVAQTTLAVGYEITAKIGSNAGSVYRYAPRTDASAWETIADLVAAENGKFYLDRGGTANFIGRYYSYDGTASYYTWGNFGGTTPTANRGTITQNGTYKPVKGVDYAYGADYSNWLRATAHPRISYGSGGTVWQNTDMDYDIEVGERGTVIVRLRDSLGRYTTAAALTVASATFSAGTATTTATAKGGKGYLVFNNTAGSVTATAGTVILTATAASQNYDLTIEIASDGTATYGIRPATYDFAAVTRERDLRELARHIFRRNNQFQGYVYSVPFTNKGDGTANAHQLAWEIGSRVNVNLSNIGHNRDYWIIGEKHSVIQDGQAHSTTFALEPTSSSTFWLIGVVGYSEIGVTTRVGY